jgi:hypothetical protein
MTERTIRFLVATTELARIPSLWATLRQEHIPNRDGRCRGCLPSNHVRPAWPCRIRRLADRARAVQTHRGE